LVDAEGRLIGLNTAILSRSGGNQGIGFAVPSDLARTVMESLIKDGRVVRGFLGVSIQDVTPALASQFHLKESGGGALVGEVTSRSPAEKAGIQSGDVITEYNGKPVKDSRPSQVASGADCPWHKVPLKVIRDGHDQDCRSHAEELPRTEVASRDGSKDSEAADALDGVTVDDLSASTKHELKLPEHVKGVVVTTVDPNSPAYEAGLREGDVIQEINRKQVSNADEAVQVEREKSKMTRCSCGSGARAAAATSSWMKARPLKQLSPKTP